MNSLDSLFRDDRDWKRFEMANYYCLPLYVPCPECKAGRLIECVGMGTREKQHKARKIEFDRQDEDKRKAGIPPMQRWP